MEFVLGQGASKGDLDSRDKVICKALISVDFSEKSLQASDLLYMAYAKRTANRKKGKSFILKAKKFRKQGQRAKVTRDRTGSALILGHGHGEVDGWV